ncbi:hypothetical protein E3N88_26553 [Mikania micrantha]|uniref:PGG domain-containing protein n=1 Tax=Mikania micrantha TaxID=192012 RepID=A0A5N6MX68_9ASTR|nr:hypothetical protein E3N88_26553 [Mikania micrantha]
MQNRNSAPGIANSTEDEKPKNSAESEEFTGSTQTKADVKLLHVAFDGDLAELRVLLFEDKSILKKKLNKDGNTMLHIAVGIGRNDFVRTILRHIADDELTEIKNSKSCTALHIAAIVGNTTAAELLLKRNKKLLHVEDNDRKKPLDKAYENMRLDTAFYLLNAYPAVVKSNIDGDHESSKSAAPGDQNSQLKSNVVDDEIGIGIVVQAISAKRYDLAEKMINQKPEYAMSNNEVLLALARTFPSGLDHMDTLFYPNLDNTCIKILKRTKMLFLMIKHTPSYLLWKPLIPGKPRINHLMIIWVYYLIRLLLFMVYFPFFMLYYLLWKLAALIVPAIKNIEQKKKEYEEAKKVLDLVCGKINPSSREFYTTPILEAACQDAYRVVDQILGLWPDAIMCKDENGYDIIQLATIHRSNKTYNLIYNFREGTNVYGTMEDSSKNNMLHLAGRLAPLNKLKRHTGAALQLQSELQWHQEVKKFVYPTYVTKKNIFEDTPEMVFTREHTNLVKEGEKWIKAVAESCSITAALITTIVFAAAITVPGGSSQNGVPVFTNETAFAVFAFSDAISLFSSVTALLVFLSILTARFAEQDFLVRLPRRLIIGLYTLLISTSAMIVAFGATLFLVFSHHKLWMIAPICGLAFLPIAIFFILQFPLILDLFRSTYISRFGKKNHPHSKCNPNEIRAFFGK